MDKVMIKNYILDSKVNNFINEVKLIMKIYFLFMVYQFNILFF
jgi:hypothetical protein